MLVGAVIIAAAVTAWIILSDIFATEFEPVELNTQEEQVLQKKLRSIGVEVGESRESGNNTLEPEAYSETDADREVRFTEREINAMLAKNTDLADKLAIDLASDLLSAKLLIPLDEEMPVLGGRTLKVTAGVEMAFKDNKPVVVVKGVSVWGVPVPSAYMGDMKNLDLVQEFGDEGFWKQFAAGLEDLQVEDGEVTVKFKP